MKDTEVKEKKISKSGQLLLATIDIISPLDNKNIGEHKAFWFQKLNKNMYLIIFDRMFKKDPYERKFRIITERNFKALSKKYKLQSNP